MERRRRSGAHRVTGPPSTIASPPLPHDRRMPWPLIPALVWMLAFFFLPLFLVLLISFASRGPYGGVQWQLSPANYTMIVDPLYLWIYGRSVLLAAATTIICLLIGYPLAYFIA